MKYLDYSNIFFLKFIVKFLEYNNNNFAINLDNSKKLSYSLICSLTSIKIKILKTYLKINIVNNFI